MRINEHYLTLEESYLFSEIAHRVARYTEAHPEADVIRMGIGDVTLPLCPAVVNALEAAGAERLRPGTGLRFPAEGGAGILPGKGDFPGTGGYFHRGRRQERFGQYSGSVP